MPLDVLVEGDFSWCLRNLAGRQNHGLQVRRAPYPLPPAPPASLGLVGANHQKCERFLKFLKCELRNRSFNVSSKDGVKFYKIALEVKSTLKKKLYRH